MFGPIVATLQTDGTDDDDVDDDEKFCYLADVVWTGVGTEEVAKARVISA